VKHGANIYKYAKKLGCHSGEIIDFSSNINLYRPEISLKITPSLLATYPDSNYTELKRIIASNYGLKKSQIALFNGATSAIFELFRMLKQKNVFLYAPLYGEYEKAAFQTKKNIYKINRISEIEEEVEEKSIVVFVNPATPEGTHYNLEKLFSYWVEQKCTIILDESFIEFEALASLKEKIKEYKKLYIIQSFSKFYASAGIRVGAIFSQKQNIAKLQTPLWNISALDELFLKQRLSDEAFKEETKKLHLKQKKELFTILENSQIFEEVVKSGANFILAYTPKGKELFKYLLEQKILIRLCGSFDYLDNNWIRFGVKATKEHQKLQEALESFYEKISLS